MVFTNMKDKRLLFEAGHELPHETVMDTPSGDISTRYRPVRNFHRHLQEEVAVRSGDTKSTVFHPQLKEVGLEYGQDNFGIHHPCQSLDIRRQHVGHNRKNHFSYSGILKRKGDVNLRPPPLNQKTINMEKTT